MKKILIYFFLLIAMAGMGGNPANVQKVRKATVSAQAPGENNVKYQVHITVPANVFLPSCGMQVIITDQNGIRVTATQEFQPGVYNYFFAEPGPVTATRVAQLQLVPGTLACSIYVYPNEVTRTFNANETYIFNLVLQDNKPK
jgi:hypothetical protein